MSSIFPDLGEIHARHELAQEVTPLGLFVLDCKEAANQNLTPEKTQRAALMARTELTGLALQKVYGKALSLDELREALANPKVEATKQEILDTLRQDKDPAVITAINTVFPQEPSPTP
jgi:hypothetical protein